MQRPNDTSFPMWESGWMQRPNDTSFPLRSTSHGTLAQLLFSQETLLKQLFAQEKLLRTQIAILREHVSRYELLRWP